MPTNNQILLTVDEATRSLKHEGRLILGVEQDHRAERVYFTLPKTIFMDADVELNNNAVTIKIVYKNASNSTYSQECTSTIVDNDDETITFSWLLTSYVFTKRGNVSFLVWVHKDVYGTDSETGEQVVVESNDWHTTPFIGEVLPGLEITDETIEPITSDSTSYAALIEMVNELDAKLDDITGYTEAEIDAMFATVNSSIDTKISTAKSSIDTEVDAIDAAKLDKSSLSTTVVDDDSKVATSKAVKTYVDNQIGSIPKSVVLTEDTTWKDSNTNNKNEDGSIRVRGMVDNDYTYFNYPETGFYQATINLTNLYDVTVTYEKDENDNDDPGVVLGSYTLPVQGLLTPGRDCYMTCNDIYEIDDKVGLLLENGPETVSTNTYFENTRYQNNTSNPSVTDATVDSIKLYSYQLEANVTYAVNIGDVDSVILFVNDAPAAPLNVTKDEAGYSKFTVPSGTFSQIYVMVPSSYSKTDIKIVRDDNKEALGKMIAKLRVWKRDTDGTLKITHRITGTITGLYKVTI